MFFTMFVTIGLTINCIDSVVGILSHTIGGILLPAKHQLRHLDAG